MATQPVEDIEAVLGRFQAWSGSKNAVEARPAIREIPYEEALASERYRWKSAAGTGKKSAPKPLSPVGSEAAQPGREKRATAKSARTTRMRAHDSSAVPTVRKPAAAPPKPEAAKRSTTEKQKKAAFREVLAEAVKPTQVVVAQPAELARQKAISIRLAPAERDLIQTRAAETGITVSAYIRQCVVEVDQLRAQVQKAMAAMDRGGAAVGLPIAPPASAPGFISRITRRFFSGKGAVLALRA